MSNFLEKIDDVYNVAREAFAVPAENKTFSCFIPVVPIDCRTTKKFVIKKQEKAKLLLIEGKQRVYISDLQVINTILSTDISTVRWFIQQFVALYRGNMHPVLFEIDGNNFEGSGMVCYDGTKEINLFSDTLVDINDFIFILNFIISKDITWEKINNQPGFSQRTLCKYIAMIDYYAMNSLHSKEFLDAIGYPTSTPCPVENKSTKNIFNNTKKFDISLYG